MSHFLQRLAAHAMGNFSECRSFWVSQPQTPLNMGSEYPILRDKILVSYQSLLINRTGDVGQHACPIHRDRLMVVIQYRVWVYAHTVI